MTEHPRRRLRFFLRDHRVLDASARVRDDHCLTAYLATRSRYIDLVDVDWLGTADDIPQMTLRLDQVLWAASTDRALPLADAADGAGRRVEVELEGGYLLRARLFLSGRRLSDGLHAAPPFVPLRDAELRPRGRLLGDIAVNQDALQVVREVAVDETPAGAADDGLPAGPL